MSSQYANSRPSNYRQSGIRAIAGAKIEVSASPEQFALWILARPCRFFLTAGAALTEFLKDISGTEGILPKGPIWCELLRVRFGRRGVTAVDLLGATADLRPVGDVDRLLCESVADPEDVIDRSRPSPLHGRWFTKEEIERAISGAA